MSHVRYPQHRARRRFRIPEIVHFATRWTLVLTALALPLIGVGIIIVQDAIKRGF